MTAVEKARPGAGVDNPEIRRSGSNGSRGSTAVAAPAQRPPARARVVMAHPDSFGGAPVSGPQALRLRPQGQALTVACGTPGVTVNSGCGHGDRHLSAQRPAHERPDREEGVVLSALRLQRVAFTTSRLAEFCGQRELVAQTGHAIEDWPLVILKELVDNALDAAEEAETAPEIDIKVSTETREIAIADNGPGIPAETVRDVLDYSSRVSSREAYASPTRGAQGNALKTLLAMPFALDGKTGTTVIETQGVRHTITFRVDQLRQSPAIDHKSVSLVARKKGTRICVTWPHSAIAQSWPVPSHVFYKSPTTLAGSTPICGCGSSGMAPSGSIENHPLPLGKSGGRAIRPLPIGMTWRGSSAISLPMSAGIRITVAIALSASSSASFAGSLARQNRSSCSVKRG
jgi:Histidine kinase-, DNA gyrase B-, and HSP90-like ATPase